MTGCRFLFGNGIVLHSPDTPPVSTFLESHPGAYTTTRTHNNAKCILFWDRHLQRLANSVRILFNSNAHLLFKLTKSTHSLTTQPPIITSPAWDSAIKSLVNDSMSQVLPIALKERREGEELAITALVSGNTERLTEIGNNVCEESVFRTLDVHVHVGGYVPPVFGVQGNGACLAVVGHGRDVAEAKYSDWVRLRKPLEKLRPSLVTELLLSNDGDQVLEGCITNFFVVCFKDNNEDTWPFEVQTAPVSDGILPGIIRQLVIEACLSKGIPLREVAPSWAKHEFWQEAFITNSLRIMQHVEKIQVPSSWDSLELKVLTEISWEEKQFGEDPGVITAIIQKEIMERAGLEGYLF